MWSIIASLTALLSAGIRPRTPLAKAIVVVLVAKLVGIAAIKTLMFPDPAKPPADAVAVARVIGVSTPMR